MPSDWFETTIGAQATLQRGIDITKAAQRPGRVPVISSGGVSSYHDTAAVKGPGVVLGRKGVVGSVYFINEDFWPHDTSLWVKDFHGNHPRFVYYFFRSIAPQLAALDVGSANPTLNRNHVHPIPVTWPANRLQQDIAGFLGTVDDRIDLLRQSNATLESIAQTLFKSWFIDFDPVHAKAEGREPEGMDTSTAALFPSMFEESPLGLIPRGWRVGAVRDVCSIFDSRRVPLSGKERAERQGPYPYYGAAALMDRVDSFIFDGVYLLLGEDGSVTNADGTPITQYVWGKFWVNNHAHVLQGANGVSTEHLMLALRGMDFTPYVTGAVQAKLNQANLFRIPFVQADPRVAEAFGSEVDILYRKLRANSEQAATLAAVRDSLLPRLISGKLRLPEAQAQLEEVIA
jgi:restriction endonuclease S subunit